ncbi:MAG: hypothetical protein RMZ69_19445 [Nostoc sp. ChiQUE01a]|nr:hypothetical protein [Nostoc sp. ChiQUE01a]
MSEQEQLKKVEFLLDLTIGKLTDITGIKDYIDFILNYRLTENNAIALQDEVTAMEKEIEKGQSITQDVILQRLGKFTTYGAPTTFISEVLKVLSPNILLKIWKT